jgi:hypothetical protein
VTAIGSQPLRYEWKHGVDTIASATGPTLLLSDLQPADGGDYTVLVSNQYGTNPATATLTALVGAMLLLARLMRLGFVANFISEPVLIGFKAGIGLVIVVDQVPKILGIHFPKGGLLHNLVSVVVGLPETSLATLFVGASDDRYPRGNGAVSSAGPGAADRCRCRNRRNGPARVADPGGESRRQIPQGFPSFSWPDFSLAAELWPGALGIAVIGAGFWGRNQIRIFSQLPDCTLVAICDTNIEAL